MPVCALSPKGFDARIEHDRPLFAQVEQVQPELIVCAGYMRIVSAEVAQRFEHRTINLHPSLLPKFRDLRTHWQCLDADDAVHSASMHWVTAELDGGPVIAQARVPVHACDDEQALEARVRQVERPLLLATLHALAAGRVRHDDALRYLATRFELNDSEQVKVPMGEREAIALHHRRTDKDREITLWIDPSLPPAPLRVVQREDGADAYELRLIELR